MKLIIIASLTALLTAIAPAEINAQANKTATMSSTQTGPLKHVVLFKFKDSSTPENVTTVQKAFSALPSKIPGMVSYEWGINVSPENLAQGYTHCFLVSFNDAADRDKYLVHPAHKEFGEILKPHLDKVLVIDFMSKK